MLAAGLLPRLRDGAGADAAPDRRRHCRAGADAAPQIERRAAPRGAGGARGACDAARRAHRLGTEPARTLAKATGPLRWLCPMSIRSATPRWRPTWSRSCTIKVRRDLLADLRRQAGRAAHGAGGECWAVIRKGIAPEEIPGGVMAAGDTALEVLRPAPRPMQMLPRWAAPAVPPMAPTTTSPGAARGRADALVPWFPSPRRTLPALAPLRGARAPGAVVAAADPGVGRQLQRAEDGVHHVAGRF